MRHLAADEFYPEEPEVKEFIILQDPSRFMGEYIAGINLHPLLTEDERNELRKLAPGYDETRRKAREAIKRQDLLDLLRKGRV